MLAPRSYKQAVATVIFDPTLAKDQLRVITDARNRTSGHITDDVNRCGIGGGAPGKPNLLSWAVMEVYSKTNDTEFLAEMYPIIEAFHHFVCECDDRRRLHFFFKFSLLPSASWPHNPVAR